MHWAVTRSFYSGTWHDLCQDFEPKATPEKKTCVSWNGSEQILHMGGTWITAPMRVDCDEFISLTAPIVHPSLDPHPVHREILQCPPSVGRAPSCWVQSHDLLTCGHFWLVLKVSTPITSFLLPTQAEFGYQSVFSYSSFSGLWRKEECALGRQWWRMQRGNRYLKSGSNSPSAMAVTHFAF